ncbi:thyrostimulin beta-5 subunit [Contarinia nasturtii]|uniref:thyrostimulin beta-5 subunit n=1 Tax=Contarinia nasturtii TaxID=265458 RepID=UPI0012D3F70E|nr:thyrostimulin beta-5 subunit [Contarinia nasturtii]XP_031630342.1 thyrostimulin beta-5 subunit [Contarinia nasturtii]
MNSYEAIRQPRIFLIIWLSVTFNMILGFGEADISTAVQGAMVQSASPPTLGCHRRLYTYRITQADKNGRKCWDDVSVWSCWGRCDSREISDWKFPYKKSYHPVCVHAGRSKAVATLRHCDFGAHPETTRYEYLEANGCNCQTCSTSDTSCEAPNIFRDESSVKVLSMAGLNSDDLEY